MSSKWEYRQEIFQGVELMNEWGAEGWELGGFFGKDGSFMILKRQVVKRGAAVPSSEAVARAPAQTRSTSARPQSRSGGGGDAKGKFKEMI